MNAILLAAGSGRRMGDLGRDISKCLIRVAGRTLIDRHIEALAACGVPSLTVVVGFHAEDVRAELDRLAPQGLHVQAIFNEEFRRGSVVSLKTALDRLPRDEDIVIMDADVLYPRALLRRLLTSAHPTAFLLDRRSESSGEEMMLGVRSGHVRCIRRRVEPQQYELLGESVGFLKVAAADIAPLAAAVDALVADGLLDAEYESAYDRFLENFEVGFEEVADLPWTELDFPEDLERAQNEILPRVLVLDAAEGGRAG